MTDVIVMGSNYGNTLGIVRSLGEGGYGVRLLALSKHVALIVGRSKYIRRVVYRTGDFQDLYQGMEELRGCDDQMLVIPLNDMTCVILEQHSDQLKAHYWIPTANGGGIARFMDKAVQKYAAQECGLLTAPGQSYTTDEDGIERAAGEVTYPCFQKPLASVRSIHAKGCFARCSNPDELRKAMMAAKENGCGEVLLEAYLSAEKEWTAYGMAINGQAAIPACMEMLRGGFGDSTGVASEGIVRSMNCLGETGERLKQLLRETGLTGLFCVDLIQSNGRLFFSEMNLRAGGSCYSVTLAGANLPAALADLVYGRSEKGPDEIWRNVHFLNEAIESEAFFNGYISKDEYKSHMSGQTERLIRNRDDRKPWKLFRILVLFRGQMERLLNKFIGERKDAGTDH